MQRPIGLCIICLERDRERGSFMCAECGRSYDRSAFRDDSIAEALRWAAKRARRFERARNRKEKPHE